MDEAQKLFAELRTIFLNYELGLRRRDRVMQARAVDRYVTFQLKLMGISVPPELFGAAS